MIMIIIKWNGVMKSNEAILMIMIMKIIMMK